MLGEGNNLKYIYSVLIGNDIINKHIICVDMRRFLDIKPEVEF